MVTAPKDRPFFILSVQPQDHVRGYHITGDVAQWRGDRGEFVIGYNFSTDMTHGCAHCWCDLHEINIAGAIKLRDTLDD